MKLIVQVFFVCVCHVVVSVFLKRGRAKCARLEFSGCRGNPGGPEAAGASHDNPRTPNVHI